MNIRDLGRQLPYPIKLGIKYPIGVVPLPIRYGRVFRDTYRFLQESQWWSKEKLEDYQMLQLKNLLDHAYKNVPYYRRVFDERDLKPKDIQSKEDLTKLPILTKEIIRHNFSDLLAENIPKRELFEKQTSGSTASPLSFFWHKSIEIPKEWSFIWTIFNISGYQFNDKRVDLTWEHFNKRLWEYDPVERKLNLSAPYLVNNDVLYTYTELRKHQPKVLKSIPSMLVALADFMKNNEISIFASIKVILCASEQIYPWQRELIEKVFKCRLFCFYGQNEHVILATQCEASDKYHVFPEYGITEIIDSDDLALKNELSMGRIIGTGFNNYAMPFIRYEVGDMVAWSSEDCTCGRNYPLLQSIEGRENEYLVSGNGDLVPIITIPYSYIMKNVKQFQFYQDVKGKATLTLVPLPAFTKDDAESISSSLRREVKNIEFTLEYTDSISRTKSGKFKYIIQKIPVKFGSLPNQQPRPKGVVCRRPLKGACYSKSGKLN